jgi:phage terminase small subunit
LQSPYLAIANKAAEQVRLLLSEFGMSPSSRTRAHARTPETARRDEDGEFERLFGEGGQ